MFVSAVRLSVRQATRARTTPLRCFVQPFSDEAKTGAAAESKKEEEIEPPQGGESKADADVIAGLQNEIKNLKDQLLRSYAEGENIRRIAQRDVDNARSYAVSSFAKATLDIADDLDRAIAVVPVEKKTTGDPVLTQLVLGIELTQKNLSKTLAQFGVVKYGAVGDKFDPNFHDALFRIPDANEPDTVGQIVKVGYKIKDRVLRPAQVGARVKPDV
eukprot:gene412-445_t